MPTSKDPFPAVPPADRRFGVYLLLFFSAWALYVLLIYPRMQALGDDSFAYAAAGIGVRLLVWVAPVFYMLRVVEHAPARALGLIAHWRRGVLIAAALSILILGVAVFRFGWPHHAMRNVTWNSVLNTSLGIGFFEEIPFRGYILQKLWTRMPFWRANALTSVIFVGFHMPGWLSLGMFTVPLALNVCLLSFVWGAIFRYSRSLWSCIISHSVNDCVSAVLF